MSGLQDFLVTTAAELGLIDQRLSSEENRQLADLPVRRPSAAGTSKEVEG